MPLDSYITADEYSEITDRNASEASIQRRKRASMMLDVRCGLNHHAKYANYDSLLLLDIENLNIRQQEYAKQWVAWFVFGLAENNDSVETAESLRLGRFQVTPENGRNTLISETLMYADQMLKASGLIRRDIRSHPNKVGVHQFLHAYVDTETT